MQQKSTLYTWTGHALPDMGIAILTAFSGKENPEELMEEDLEKFAEYAEKAYLTPALTSYLSVLFTINCGSTNPSSTINKKKKYTNYILRAYKENISEKLPVCIYCKRPSVELFVNNEHLPICRDVVPMLTGRGMINFFPKGIVGLPLCGFCVLAIQALSIGSPKCGGKALIIHSEDHSFLMELIKNDEWLPRLRKIIQLSETSDSKLPAMSKPKTRIIEIIERARKEENVKSSVTIYHLSNSGQGPGIDIYYLPCFTINFVIRAKTEKFSEVWENLSHSSWDNQKEKDNNENYISRNYLYEDLFTLPEEAGKFIRTYFLRKGLSLNLMTWSITELFLKEVLGMQKARIEAIKLLGDKIAEEIVSNNDKRLWEKVYRAGKFIELRNILITQSIRMIKAAKEPITSFNNFLEIFEEGEELARVDWKLAWDLVIIRIIDKLYETKWFDKNKDVLETKEEENS